MRLYKVPQNNNTANNAFIQVPQNNNTINNAFIQVPQNNNTINNAFVQVPHNKYNKITLLTMRLYKYLIINTITIVRNSNDTQ